MSRHVAEGPRPLGPEAQAMAHAQRARRLLREGAEAQAVVSQALTSLALSFAILADETGEGGSGDAA